MHKQYTMVQLLGVPFDANSSFLRGAALAPGRIRQMDTDGSANRYCEMGAELVPGIDFIDLGDMEFGSTHPQTAYEQIRQRVATALSVQQPLLCLGGDHSISLPIIESHAQVYGPLHVLHIDAHADTYAHFDDNPYSHASPFARLLERGSVARLTQVGVRTLTQHHREQAVRYGIQLVEMKDFQLDFLTTLQAPLYVSLDLDALDPAFAPGVSHHEPGGLSTRQLLQLLQQLPIAPVGADLVELNPVRDIHHQTAMVAYKLMKELLYLLGKGAGTAA